MKRVFVLLFVLYPMLARAQEPVKNNNAIIVRGVAFNNVKGTLLDAGIFIDEQNAEDGTIITKPKGYCECPNKEYYLLIYYIRVKDSVATIKAKWNSPLRLIPPYKDDIEDVVYWKAKNSAPHYLFGIMIDFAKSLGGSSIEFKTL